MFEIYNFNYNEQYNNELCSLVETERRNYFNILRNDYSWKYQKSFRYLYNYIYDNCPDIFKSDNYPFSQAIEWVLSKRTQFPKCQLSSCDVILNRPGDFISIDCGYKKGCCRSHGTKNFWNNATNACISARVENTRHTNIIYYGVDNQFKRPDVMAHARSDVAKQQRLEHAYDPFVTTQRTKSYNDYILKEDGYIPLFSLNEYIKNQKPGALFLFKHLDCGTEFLSPYDSGKHRQCPKCFQSKNKSIQEQILANYIKSIYSGKIVRNIKNLSVSMNKLQNKEIDIFLPELNIGIEYDGIYWHSAEHLNEDLLNPVFNAQYIKTLLCENQNIALIHVLESNWQYNADNIKLFLYDLIVNQNITKYVNSTMLDRMIFNKTCISKFLPQYKIINETSPTYTTIGKLHVGNAGYFIVNKL